MFVVSDWIQLAFIFSFCSYEEHTAFMKLFHLIQSKASPFVPSSFFPVFCRIHLWNTEIQLWNTDILVCVCVCVCARGACVLMHVRACEFLEEGVIFHFMCASCIDILLMMILTQFSKGLWRWLVYYVNLVHYPPCTVCVCHVSGLIFG